MAGFYHRSLSAEGAKAIAATAGPKPQNVNAGEAAAALGLSAACVSSLDVTATGSFRRKS